MLSSYFLFSIGIVTPNIYVFKVKFCKSCYRWGARERVHGILSICTPNAADRRRHFLSTNVFCGPVYQYVDIKVIKCLSSDTCCTYSETPSNENHAGVTSVNISVVPVGTLSPTYSVVFSAWVHQVPVATRSLVGVTLDRLPSHLVTRPTGTQATVLLTREVLREIRQPSQHIKSYTSDAYTAQKVRK